MKSNAKKVGNRNKRPSLKAFDAEKGLRHFSDATSQELATVLAAIVGELDFALSTDSATAKERATMIAITAAERALALARNLRYFSVHSKLSSQVIDLSQVVLDTVELVEKELEHAHVKIGVLAEASSYVEADPGALQQTLLNLLAHAKDGLPKGGQITVSLRQSGKTIEIRCTDNGRGIPESELDYLFEQAPSEPGQPSQPRPQRLGLHVAKALIQAQGGDLTVQSREGLGTSVTLSLPFDPKLPKPTPFHEERRHRRIPLSLPVELFLSKGQTTLHSELCTLSYGGCFTLMTGPQAELLPELNDIVSLRIRYFGEESLEISKGRIASVSWAGNRSGIGIEFLELDARAKKLLEAILKSHST